MVNTIDIDFALEAINKELAHLNKNRAYAAHNSHSAAANADAYIKGFADGKAEAFRIACCGLVRIMEKIELEKENPINIVNK